MIPIEIKDLVRSQIKEVLDLRLLRGTIPWSLAGTDGNRRASSLARRDSLVSRIYQAIRPLGWTAAIEPVRSEAGRANKLELVITAPDGGRETWAW